MPATDDFTPHVERIEDTTTIERASAKINLIDTPFGTEIELHEHLRASIGGVFIGRPESATSSTLHLVRSLTVEHAYQLWDVLTVAIMELEPGRVQSRLLSLEGDEVFRQESGQ